MRYITHLVMPDFPSDQKLSSKATIEKYNGMEIPFDPAMLSFPQQLFQLLQIAENNHQQEIISWAEDGKSFTVHDPNKFEAKLLVKYFQMRKYASFTRQLCAYGFSCVRKGRKPGLYYHPNFIRDNYDACKRITRGSGKAYPKKSVTYTGERPHGQFRSSSQVEDTRNERSKILPYPTFLPIPSSATQELQTNLERATASPVVSELSSSLQESRSSSRSFTPPPQADTCTSFTIPTRTSVSALHDDHKLVPASQNALEQSLFVENGSPGRLSEDSAADASAMEPRSIQEMLEVPDFPWNNKSERESNS